MTTNSRHHIVVALSILLAILIVISAACGLFLPVVYAKESAASQAMFLGYDIVDLFVVAPVLAITTLLAQRGNKEAFLLRPGMLLYSIHTFSTFCFGIHFSEFFIVYCLILGLSVYLFLWFLLTHHREPVAKWFDEIIPFRTIGSYLVAVGVIFYLLWMFELLPASLYDQGGGAASKAGILNNPARMIDLSVFLPGLIMTGILLLRKHSLGFLMAPGVLFFCVVIDMSIGVQAISMNLRGVGASWMIPISMSVFALFSLVMLGVFLWSLILDR